MRAQGVDLLGVRPPTPEIVQVVRCPGGNCAAVFRPKLLSRVRRTRHLCFVWDGRGVTWVYEKRFLSPGGSRRDRRR